MTAFFKTVSTTVTTVAQVQAPKTFLSHGTTRSYGRPSAVRIGRGIGRSYSRLNR